MEYFIKKGAMSKYKSMFFSLLFVGLSLFSTISAAISDAELISSEDKKSLGVSIKESILHAKESILIFTFSLSDPEIIGALNQKANEGLKVTVIVDKEHLGEIKTHKVPLVEVLTRLTGEGHLHHKLLVIDEKEVWIGSANFTKSAYHSQENLMVKFESKELGEYLTKEADVFRYNQSRVDHGPLPIFLLTQDLYYCHLPHEGFPPKKIEKSINTQTKQFLIEKINEAKTKISIAMMVWTNNDLAKAVIEAKKRGVEVQVVAPDFGGVLLNLMAAGIPVIVNPKLSFMHNKMMIIDDHILVNGSANWSQSSFTRNDESFVVIEPLTFDQLQFLNNYWHYLLY